MGRGINSGLGRKPKDGKRSIDRKAGPGPKLVVNANVPRATDPPEPTAPPPPRPRPRKAAGHRRAPKAPRELSMDPGAVNARLRRQKQRDDARAIDQHGLAAAAALAAPSRPSEAAGVTASSRAAALLLPLPRQIEVRARMRRRRSGRCAASPRRSSGRPKRTRCTLLPHLAALYVTLRCGHCLRELCGGLVGC